MAPKWILVAFALSAITAPAPAADTKCGMTAVEIVTKFSQLFFVEKKWREAFMTYVAEDYTQHNPMAQDGREDALRHLGPIFDANPDLRIEIKQIFGDESRVAVHYLSVMKPGARGSAAVDMFRVKDCKIVEHWDVIQPMPVKSANPHPMF
ncbi:nuclear transport factor 2 family protein [Sphingobium nicotianae]|uniref:Nuclear transport factor 2 family protein n=1 Tax=Sphingobium nicotianae TaxID=2782607 RepID=A0A9X1DBU1_9SPHN|nr:nuclear transport factor 2 family protein [Sphingobium nicotianae]MBT2187010.1 nuclear transport factor 2 family protein [Sphingobium nicotianae]